MSVIAALARMRTRTGSPSSVRRIAAAMLVALVAAVMTAEPADARSLCIADATEDVERLDVAERTLVSRPSMDLTTLCAGLAGGVLTLEARVDRKLDPRAVTAEDAEDERFWSVGGVLVFEVLVDPAARNIPPTFRVALANRADGPRWEVLVGNDPDVPPCLTREYEHDDRSPFYAITLSVEAVTAACDGVEGFGSLHVAVFTAEADVYFDDLPPFDTATGDRYAAQVLDGQPDPDLEPGIRRLAGANRVLTAIAASQELFAAPQQVDQVVLASGDAVSPQENNSPDALAGAPMAVHVDGPLLLTLRAAAGQPALDPDVLAEIQRVLRPGGIVHVLGGAAAIAPDVDAELAAAGFLPLRFAGCGRFQTALLIAGFIAGGIETTGPNGDGCVEAPEFDGLRPVGRVVFADGGDFAPALLGGAYAAQFNRGSTPPAVVLLTAGGPSPVVPDLYVPFLAQVQARYTAVGALAISAATSPEDGFLGELAERFPQDGGDDLEAAAAEIARLLPFDGRAVVASALDFPDGLAAGAVAGHAGVPLLLVQPDVLSQRYRDYFAGTALYRQIVVMGGPAALRHQVAADLFSCALDPNRSASCEILPR